MFLICTDACTHFKGVPKMHGCVTPFQGGLRNPRACALLDGKTSEHEPLGRYGRDRLSSVVGLSDTVQGRREEEEGAGTEGNFLLTSPGRGPLRSSRAADWQGLHAHETISPPAVYQAGLTNILNCALSVSMYPFSLRGPWQRLLRRVVPESKVSTSCFLRVR